MLMTTTKPPSEGRFLTVSEAAARLQVSVKTIRRLIDRGDLPALRIGHLIRIPEESFESFLEARKIKNPHQSK
jgi:excisionase family DNA binding protein